MSNRSGIPTFRRHLKFYSKASEQDIRTSELRYCRLFEAAQDGILLLDAQTGSITDVNPFLIKLLGYTREEFIQRKRWEVGAFKDIETSTALYRAKHEARSRVVVPD